LKTEPARFLILETKGFDPREEVKRQAAHRWVTAVNAEGSYGQWQYALANKIGEINRILRDAAAGDGGA
jgi:type III restriction enzyme